MTTQSILPTATLLLMYDTRINVIYSSGEILCVSLFLEYSFGLCIDYIISDVSADVSFDICFEVGSKIGTENASQAGCDFTEPSDGCSFLHSVGPARSRRKSGPHDSKHFSLIGWSMPITACLFSD
jgi:hypothetical protein